MRQTDTVFFSMNLMFLGIYKSQSDQNILEQIFIFFPPGFLYSESNELVNIFVHFGFDILQTQIKAYTGILVPVRKLFFIRFRLVSLSRENTSGVT